MPPPNVFLSHSHEDAEIARRIAIALQENGASVFYDNWDIKPGDSLIDKIFREGLEGADYFIVLLSRKSVESRWVKEELDSALIRRIENQTVVVPVVVEECRIPLPLRAIRWLDLTKNYEQGEKTLIKLVHGINDRPPLGEAPEFVTELISPYGGLGSSSTTLGHYIVSTTQGDEKSVRSFKGEQLKEALPQLSVQEINDAVAELEDWGYVKTHNWLGMGQWHFGMAEPVYTIYNHFKGLSLNYDPDEDICVIAAFLAKREQAHAGEIAAHAEFSPNRVNRAVAYLDDYGIIERYRTLGTAPFDFSSVRTTARTRRFVEENCV